MTVKKSLNIAILAMFVPVMALLYVIMIVGLQNNMYQHAIDSLQKLSVEAQIYTINYVEREQKDAKSALQNGAPLVASYLSKRMGVRVQVINGQHEIAADTNRLELPHLNEDIAYALSGDKAYVLEKAAAAPLLLFSSPVYVDGQVIGVVRFIQLLEGEGAIIKRMNWSFLLACAFLFVAVALFVNRYATSLSRPIEKLRDMAQQLADGRYQSKIELRDYKEIMQLAQSFNIMADAIELHIQRLNDEKVKQKDFLDRVTHELKTPLTAIMGYANLIPRLQRRSDVTDSLRHISVESERLLALVEELLSSSKYGNSQFTVSPTICEIQNIVREAVRIVQPRLDKYSISWRDELGTANVSADPDKTKQIFLNLLDNAIKYSDATMIACKLEVTESHVTVEMKDDGIGMSPELLSSFRQLPQGAALPSSYGNGFGLLICRDLMKQQGGEMSIAADDEGTAIRLQFRRPAWMLNITSP